MLNIGVYLYRFIVWLFNLWLFEHFDSVYMYIVYISTILCNFKRLFLSIDRF